MGNCRSYESRSNVTAKLILLDGGLQEFSCPVKVPYMLQINSDSIICSAEDIKTDEFLVAIDSEDVLQLGEVYFELPLGWQSHRLKAEDMAALVVKASEAFRDCKGSDDYVISCCCCCCCRCVSRNTESTVLFSEKERPLLAVEDVGGLAERGGVRGESGGCKKGKFVAKLRTIVELEE